MDIALVGIGKIALDQHVPALAASGDWTLAASVSRHGTVDGIEAFTDLETMLAARPEIGTVSLCLPPVPRFAAAQSVLRAGRHLMLEKPPGATLAEVHILQDMARAQGVSLFATWHSRMAHGVAAARRWLVGRTIHEGRITWREDVRKWHPGQDWIFEAGGMGVFDPGINALSILTEILPQPVHLTDAQLDFPANRQAPIAARLTLSHGIEADFDFRQQGPRPGTWNSGPMGAILRCAWAATCWKSTASVSAVRTASWANTPPFTRAWPIWCAIMRLMWIWHRWFWWRMHSRAGHATASIRSNSEGVNMTYTPSGKHLIRGEWVGGDAQFSSDPVEGPSHRFASGTAQMVDRACVAAEDAFWTYANTSRADRAAFLEAIADEIEARAEDITLIGAQESGLPPARLQGERGRTTGQLRLFADHIRDGAYLDRRHDARTSGRAAGRGTADGGGRAGHGRSRPPHPGSGRHRPDRRRHRRRDRGDPRQQHLNRT